MDIVIVKSIAMHQAVNGQSYYQYALFWGEVEGERRAKFPTVASRATRQDFRCDATAFLAS